MTLSHYDSPSKNPNTSLIIRQILAEGHSTKTLSVPPKFPGYQILYLFFSYQKC